MHTDRISIREGIGGVWHYHFAVDDECLCGDPDTMSTSVPVDAWGIVTHLHETYCAECESLARDRGILE